MQIRGLILAGGEGRRFGGVDKALLVFAGERLIDRAVARLLPQVSGLAISANGDPGRFAALGYPVLGDADPAERLGPMAGLCAGLEWLARAGGSHLATVPVDAPFLPLDLVTNLAAAAVPGTSGAAVAESGGRLHPTCGLWPVGMAAQARAALAGGERRIGRWAADVGAVPVTFPAGAPDPFSNLNTLEDLHHAERAARGG